MRRGDLVTCLVAFGGQMEATLSDQASVEDNRVIAEHASELLG